MVPPFALFEFAAPKYRSASGANNAKSGTCVVDASTRASLGTLHLGNLLHTTHIVSKNQDRQKGAIMRWTYACPHCQAMLNPDETVVLIGECGPHRILLGFHPEPGNYRAFFPPEFELQEGSMWDFSCPVCDRSLVASAAPDLCALDLATQGVRHRLYFSRTAGEQATFLITAEGITSHGKDSDQHSLEMLELI